VEKTVGCRGELWNLGAGFIPPVAAMLFLDIFVPVEFDLVCYLTYLSVFSFQSNENFLPSCKNRDRQRGAWIPRLWSPSRVFTTERRQGIYADLLIEAMSRGRVPTLMAMSL
jgi:hypothetical protein